VRIEVEDECGGMEPTQIDSMFQAFSPGASAQSRTGLGLVISRQAVEANEGSLSVLNTPGRGCVFVIELPRATAPASTPILQSAEAF
jgi:signal transduction histidine kinase